LKRNDIVGFQQVVR